MNAAAAEKPLALLIPGLDGTGRFFEPHLDGISPRYRVLPWRFRNRSEFSFEDLIDELAAGTTNSQKSAGVVIGESFGGTLAMMYVLKYPERASRLVLINTFAYYNRRLRLRLGCRLAPLLSWAPAQKVKNAVADAVLALEGISPAERHRYHDIVREVDPAAYQRRLRLVGEVDLRDRLSEIMVPTLIFASGRDKIVPSVKQARLMSARIPRCDLHEFPRAGHALLLTPGFSLADYI